MMELRVLTTNAHVDWCPPMDHEKREKDRCIRTSRARLPPSTLCIKAMTTILRKQDICAPFILSSTSACAVSLDLILSKSILEFHILRLTPVRDTCQRRLVLYYTTVQQYRRNTQGLHAV
jgi:hypothetical protein